MRLFLVTFLSKTDPCAHCDIAKRQSKGTSMLEIVCPFCSFFIIQFEKKKFVNSFRKKKRYETKMPFLIQILGLSININTFLCISSYNTQMIKMFFETIINKKTNKHDSNQPK